MAERKKPQRIQITERDLAIFESLSAARFLTPQALEWLHFPDWEARYKAWQERGKDAGPYEVSGRLYGRLRRFREVRPPLVHRIIRPVALSTAEFRRDVDAYVLAEGGAELLVEAGRMSMEDVHWEALRERSAFTLAHSVLIGTFYAAMRVRLTRARLGLEDWRGDHILARDNYDLVTVLRKPNKRRRDQKWPVLPDAAFFIRAGERRHLAFVEIDREWPVASWREKVMAYEAYRGSKALQARYGVDDFLVLAATTSAAHRRKLVQATGEELQRADTHYQFMLIGDIHPLTIGDRWTVAGEVKPGKRVMVNGRLRETWEVSEAPHTLIKGS